ncbi:DUF3558 domain-containing protein [Streptomyces sp. NPDC006551]|uniref:DUF3558 domain-containing protein n=1 Tax=Streptomyces sp. NPDC006551 TaxID=3157178 RepID=UPI0033B2030F
MQRQAYGPGRTGRTRPTALTAAALVLGIGAGLTGCSAATGGGEATVDSKAGPVTAVAPPGRYRTLFEPCRAVSPATLKDLLPGAAALPDPERDKAYRGTATVTYDTDRRVGCTWKADTPDASHRLVIDIERVVSYDPATSDDARAQEVFDRKQAAADLPQPPQTQQQPQSPAGTASTGTGAPSTSTSAPGTSTGTPSPVGPTPLTVPSGTGAPATGTANPSAPTAPSPGSTTGLEPRVLEGLGDVAFLDDALTTAGSSGGHRTVSVVFRTSNVIVTVEYLEQTTGSAEAPDSRELQERTRNLADLLAERLEE